MKRYFLMCIILIVTLSSNSYGQLQTGISFGLNYNRLESDGDFGIWKNGIGFNVSGLLEKSFNKVSVLTKPSYTFNNMKNTVYDANLSLHYLSMPVIVTYMPFKFMKVGIGPEIKLLLYQNEQEIKTTFDNEDFNSVDYGIRMELLFVVSKKVHLSAGSYLGLQYNNEREYRAIDPTDPSVGKSIKLYRLNSFDLSVNYLF